MGDSDEINTEGPQQSAGNRGASWKTVIFTIVSIYWFHLESVYF